MVAKRELEFTDYREIDDEIGRKCKHSWHLLPVKRARTTFMVNTAMESSLWFVGFAPCQQRTLKGFQVSRKSVEMKNL